MSQAKPQKDVADQAIRASKLLERNKPRLVGPEHVPNLRLASTPGLGEYSVVLFVTPLGTRQYVVSRPIGMTNLDANDWVITEARDAVAALQRTEDPYAGEVNKARAVLRNKSCVEAGVLVPRELNGKIVYHYPGDLENSRNSHLDLARTESKADAKAIRTGIENLSRDASAATKQELNRRLQECKNILGYLGESIRSQEVAVRNHLKTVEKAVEETHPYTHKTLVGPFADQPQRAIDGCRGYPLTDVDIALQKSLITARSVGNSVPAEPSSKPKSEPFYKRGRGRRGSKKK